MKKNISIKTSTHFSRIFVPLLLSLLFFAGYRSCATGKDYSVSSGKSPQISPRIPSGGEAGTPGIIAVTFNQAPRHVRQLIEKLKNSKHFNPPTGFKGGRFFRNREGVLPQGKTYYEYDVRPYVKGQSRGAERLVVDQQKQNFYYTKDHYKTFIKID